MGGIVFRIVETADGKEQYSKDYERYCRFVPGFGEEKVDK